MTDNRNNNNELQNNQQRPYFTDSQLTTGNIFTGEHRQVRRSTQWDHVPSAQELRGEARDMLNQARQLPNAGLLEQRNYETDNSSALAHRQQNALWTPPQQVPLYDRQGRQITDPVEIKVEVARREAEWAATHGGRPEFSDFELGPTIGPIQMNMYDEHGHLITDQRRIQAEVARREAEWRQWEREGRIQNSRQRTITTRDGNFATSYRGLEPSIREIESSDSRFAEIVGIASSSSSSSQTQHQVENQNEVEEVRRQSREAERSRRETESETRIQQQEDKPVFLACRK